MAKDEKLDKALDLIMSKNEDVTPKDFVDKDEIIEDEEADTEKPVDEPITEDDESKKKTKEKKVEKKPKETKKVEEPIPSDPDEPDNKKINIDFKSRGFNNLKEAQNFIKTDYFKGLGKVDQEEYLNWLK